MELRLFHLAAKQSCFYILRFPMFLLYIQIQIAELMKHLTPEVQADAMKQMNAQVKELAHLMDGVQARMDAELYL